MTPLRLRIAELRQARGWTQDQLARESGVARNTINRMERGKTTRVEFDVLEKLAATFGVDPGYLIERVRATSSRRPL